jgi:AcrR family transcriptional regulator
MARPRARADDPATTDRLLEAAETEFAENGFESTRLEDIARAVGIRRPSLLYHFGSKEALYAAVIRRVFARLGEVLTGPMAADATFDRRVAGLVDSFVAFLEAHPSVAPLLLREAIDGRGPGRQILLDEVVPLLGRIEAFVAHAGVGVVREGLPVREAILQAAAALLLRSAVGPALAPLWNGEDHAKSLTLTLFLEGGHPAAGKKRRQR